MNTKNISILALCTVMGLMSSSAVAATYCSVYVDNTQNQPNGVVVSTSNISSYSKNDPFIISYQDNRLGEYLNTLTNAKNNNTPLKIYILEEFRGDDAKDCRDGVTDYIGSIHSI